MSADELKSKGNAAFSAGDYAEAAEHFTAAIAADPANHVFFSNRSAAYASMGKFQQALQDAQKVVQLAPDWPKGHSRVGAAAHGLGQWDKAVQAYSRGLELDPSNEQLKQGLQDAKAAAAASARPQPHPASAAPRHPSYRSRTGGLDMRWVVLAVAQASLILFTVAGLQPFNKYVGWTAFHLFCRTALVTCIVKLFLSHGFPRLSPFPAALMPWLQDLSQTSDLFHLMLTGLMLQNPMLWLGMIPIAISSAYSLAGWLAANTSSSPLWRNYGARAHQWLLAHRQLASQAEAATEIALGFQAVLSVFTMGLRAAVSAFVYWQQLRIRYWMPASRPYHSHVWATLGQRFQPLLRMAPFLQPGIDKAVAWFQQPGLQAGHGR